MINRTPGNELVAAMPPCERARLLSVAERVTLSQDDVVAVTGARIHHAYFPLDCIFSLLIGDLPHNSLALGLIGREGMLGTSLVLGGHIASLHARVQGAGDALRVNAADFHRVLVDMPALDRRMRRYVDLEFAQLASTASCAVFHRAELRLATWLLMAHDRTDGDRLYLTHDRLATLLGIRRSGVTLAACELHRAGLITYTRGHIAIVDRKGLERAACSCYRSLRHSSRETRSLHSSKRSITPASILEFASAAVPVS